MNFAYDLSGAGVPIMKKYRVGSGSSAKAAGYMTGPTAGVSGLVLGTATSTANAVGSSLDAATGSTTPTSDATALTTVIINPGAVYRLLIVKGATGGQLDVITESSGGSKTANTITGAEQAPNSPEMDEGTIVCVAGANKGQVRKITSTAATVATITEGWVNNNAVGDQFIMVPFMPTDVAGNNVNLTTSLAQARQDIAVGTGADMRHVELVFDLASVATARNNSYLFATFDDQIFNVTT